MPKYVDGFLLVIPKKRLADYRTIARKASKVWKDHGALDYVETMGDDLIHPGMGTSFAKVTKLKAGEIVIFSWIVYKSRAHRDAVNKKVVKDKRMAAMMTDAAAFDMKRMNYGGFTVLVDG
ncbi:MAG: DUF1428 domain-containing protein [Acidobacteriota bacterium]|nr:DUF1428 domain-containing protein [Acidobacteriota bacterium]